MSLPPSFKQMCNSAKYIQRCIFICTARALIAKPQWEKVVKKAVKMYNEQCFITNISIIKKHFCWPTWPCRKSHNNPSNHCELQTQWHSARSQKNWIFSNTGMTTLNLHVSSCTVFWTSSFSYLTVCVTTWLPWLEDKSQSEVCNASC